MKIGPHLLGRNVEHDPRSRAFPATPRRLVKPRVKTHRMGAPALNQGNIGSCVGHTAAQWLNCVAAANNRKRGVSGEGMDRRIRFKYLNDDDARTLYKRATELDDFAGTWTPDDTGSSGLGGAKALQYYGFINEYRHVFDFAALCAVVIEQPVMAGLNWYESMFDTDSDGVIHVAGDVAGGHEILIRGIDFTNGFFLLRNHWTPQWGVNGDCRISFDDMQRLMHEDGDITVPVILK